MESQCSNCLELNQTITTLKRINQNLIDGHDRLTKSNAQLRKEVQTKQKQKS